MDGVSKGNAKQAGSRRGWFVGHFVSTDAFRQTALVEMKWGLHQTSNRKKPFEGNRSACSMSLLLKGKFRFEFRRREQVEEVRLTEPSEYVIWLPNVEHRGFAEEDNTEMMTLRWPSVPNDVYQARRYAIWLVPSGEQRGFLESLIADLASRYGSRPFPPHMTVCSGEFSGEISVLLNEAAPVIDSLQPTTLTVQGLDCRGHFFTFLFAKLLANAGMRLFENATNLMPGSQVPDAGPHLSLLYSNQFAVIDRFRIIRELLPTLPKTVVFDEAQVVVPREGDWNDLGSWQVLSARKLFAPKPQS